MILTHRLNTGNVFVDMEFDGPYDRQLWTFKGVNLEPFHEAAVIGDGVDFRSAAESATRALLRTPFEVHRTQVESEVQQWLATRQDADVKQGDREVRVYCVLKFLR